MLAVPAPVWRWGPVGRAVVVGACTGVCLGALAWLESGAVVSGAAALIVGGGVSGVVTARRMAHFWPQAAALASRDRVMVARAVRRGDAIVDARLAAPALDYTRGLQAAARMHPAWRWILAVVIVVALATGVWDAMYGSWGNAAASAVYLAALLAEVVWWPRRRAQLLAHAGHAVRRIQSGS